MSFDVFLQCFGDSEPIGLPRQRVRSLFPIVEKESDSGRWVVRYDDINSSDMNVDPDERPLRELMISRPCGDRRFWEALLSILQMGNVVMFWPGSPPLVARGSSPNLPTGMVEALGEPVEIENSGQFFELLKVS